MRGTKHDASQHQRRGIRSRLIASVAAVAMLATSIAAGTAVAADIDETDPTQQNTIVEQPQQGTENAGDQTGEQNTESEGDQTTPSQEPGDTATEAESDNTAEADSTEEADPKADADKADGDQLVVKQPDAVPAPQAEGVSPRLNDDRLLGLTHTSDKVSVKLFDYESSDDANAAINKGHALKFGKTKAIGGEGGTGINAWTGSGQGVRQGIVKQELSDGYPVLSGDDGESLKYLFDPRNTEGNQYVHPQAGGKDVDGLFQYDEDTGYYEYDSRYNFATFDDGADVFRLYNTGRFTEYKKSGRFQQYHELNDSDPLPASTQVSAGAFHPFNTLTGQQTEYMYDGAPGRWKGYGLTGGVGSANYSFGLTVGAEFYMPDDRKVNGENMVFEFGGDDDVWVFLDGKLVMDLGGVHDYRKGTIDFTNGTVTIDSVYRNGSSQTDVTKSLTDLYSSDDWQDATRTHELKVFYLERGAGGSNCRFRFNLPTISSDQIQIAKKVTSGDASDMNKTYRFNAYVSNDGASASRLYEGEYVVRTSGSTAGGEPKTATGGVIELKANQYATLTDPSISINAKYNVTELDASGYTVTASGGANQSINVTMDNGTATTATVTVADVPYLTVTNTKPLGEPKHSKKIGKNDDGTYTLNLDVIGQNTEGSETVQTTPLDIVLVLDASGSMDNDQQDSNPYINSYEKTYSLRNRETYYVRDDGGWHEVSYQYLAGKWGYNAGSNFYPDWRYFTPMESADDTDSSHTQFYTMRRITKMEALQDAAGSFVDSVAALNGDNRIALVKFSGNQTDTIGNGTYQYYGNTWNYTQVVQDLTKVDSSASAGSMKSRINELDGDGGTRADYGLDMASKVLNGKQLSPSTKLTGAREDAQKVVIFFTDGQPTEISDWSDSVASGAVSSAYGMKQDGTLIYSVGVVSGANPSSDPTSASNINKFLHAVSSNYPNAEYTSSHGGYYYWDFGQRVSADKQYYFAASDASQLSGVFNDIFEDVQTGASYSNVAIVDELSQWAQVDSKTVKYKTEADGDGFYEVTAGVTLKVQKPGDDGDWVTVDGGDDGYPDAVRFLYKPAADGAADSTGTVKAVFGADYKLRQGWKYTLEFKVVPTDAAYQEYADNGYGDVTGAEGTDLYTKDSTPEGGVPNTSVGKPGFHSNNWAYVEYTSAGKPDKAPYDHPVLQVDVTPVVIGSQVGLQEKKTVIGASAEAEKFDFTVTATGDNAKDAAELAGWAQCSDGQSDRCYVMSDKGAVYSFSNLKGIAQGESAVVRSAGGDDGVKFTPDMVGKTFTYVYEESDRLPDNWHNQSDVKVWTVTATVEYKDATKKALQVTVNVYHGEDVSVDPADTYVYTSDVPKPDHTAGSSGDSVPTVSFTNTYVAPVSSLPLTGGSSTARTLLLAGGGVLLVAGAAWLLARRRRV